MATAQEICDKHGLDHISWSSTGQCGRVAITGDVYVEALDPWAVGMGLSRVWREVPRNSAVPAWPVRILLENGDVIGVIKSDGGRLCHRGKRRHKGADTVKA